MEMTRLAAADDDRFSVSSLEVDREGPSYTYETLEALAEERGDRELVFVMGADAAVGLESWREPERVVELASLAVARRAGVSDAEVADGDAQPRLRGPGDDAGDAAVRRLLLGGARAGRSRAGRCATSSPSRSPTSSRRRGSTGEPRRSPRSWRGSWPRSPTRKKPRTSSSSTCATWSPTPTSW